MMTHGNYLPNPANYAYKYLRGSRSMSKRGLKPRKERGFHIRKYKRARQMQSPKNNAKIVKGGVLTSTMFARLLLTLARDEATYALRDGIGQQLSYVVNGRPYQVCTVRSIWTTWAYIFLSIVIHSLLS
jgi:hypothetical protein